MVTCKSIEMVKLTVTVFIYHETGTLRNEFSNHNTVSLVGKARVSRAGSSREKPLQNDGRSSENLWHRLNSFQPLKRAPCY